jgi:hypothetical protein
MALLVSVVQRTHSVRVCHLLLLLTLPLSKGVISWDDPTTPDIKAFASRLALSMLSMTQFILNPSATFRHTTIQGVDVGLWKVNSTDVLVLATNTKYSSVSIPITSFGLPSSGISVKQVLDTGTKIDSDRANISFESVGSGAFIINI